MSDGFTAPPPPSAPAPRTRPTTVTIAGILMLVVAVAALIYLIASVAALGDLSDGFEAAYEGTELADIAGVMAASTLIAGVVYLLFGIALAILTVFNNQGRNGSRIATWVVGGVGLCCGGVSLIGIALGDVTSGMGDTDDPNLPDTEEIVEIMAQYEPGWFAPLTTTSTVIGVLALAAGLLLLALPPSNEFFRKPEQQFQPPPGYPPVG
ncbi:hypothetical protein JQS43_01060 [Natronosporangium hydrolyticum]|uniref:Uncharacterized protein n=1 Tax=Natronosporangium hydrolyticum TaxID=2811111 RepID=A0A895YC27_9ACTN|nr:hypothetical protein [Natronosporangium hydrolyticum]QSB15011.1 hypothetical protein JQS43_01060 [Natronosporangium hydrolyticum]